MYALYEGNVLDLLKESKKAECNSKEARTNEQEEESLENKYKKNKKKKKKWHKSSGAAT